MDRGAQQAHSPCSRKKSDMTEVTKPPPPHRSWEGLEAFSPEGYEGARSCQHLDFRLVAPEL